jgi:hypothetical protein
MNGKKILSLVMVLSLGLSAFSVPAQPRLDTTPKMVIQLLTVVHENGSANFSYVVKLSKTLVQTLQNVPNFSESTMCEDVFESIETSVVQFKQEQHGEDIWCTYTKNLDDLPALKAQWTDEFDHLTVRRLEIKGGTFYLDISWTSFPCATNDASTLTCEWAVQMPGKAGSNNATKVEGTTLTWDISSASTPFHFTAQSAIGGGFLGMDSTTIAILAFLMCLCCLVILLAGGGIAAYLILRRRKSAQAASKPAAVTVPVGPPGPSPQP